MVQYLLACLLAVPFSLALAGQDEAWLVLEKASQAARALSYQGVFVYQSGAIAKSVQITHTNSGQGEYARMVVLDGSPREVLTQGGDVVIFSPKSEKVIIEKRRAQNMFPALLPANLNAIKNSYQIRMGGTERVGGRDGQIIFLDPRDHFRYGYKFWADLEFGLLLKVMKSNERNEPLEQIAFSQIALFNTPNMDWFRPDVDHHKTYVMEEATATATPSETEDWVMAQVPPGYRKVDQVLITVPGKQVPVTQLVFSDGLASVSLFIEPLAKSTRPKTGHVSVGTTNFYAAVSSGHQIVVVGEVPEATVAQFANAVTFKK